MWLVTRRACSNNGQRMRRGLYDSPRALLLLLAAATVLLLQSSSAISGSTSGSPAATTQHHAAHTGSSARTLQQQQPSSTNNDDGLVVADDSSSPSTATTIPNNNTNASTPNVLSRLGSALLPKSIKSQLQLLRSSMAQAVQDHSSGRRARAAAALHPRMRPLHHHRVVRHNTTHTWVHSPLLDLELPQPWDALNLTTIVRDNLEPDLSFWQQLHRQPSTQDILDMAKTHPSIAGLPATSRLVEIRGNSLRFPLMPPGKQLGCDADCDPQLQGFVDALKAAVEVYNLTLPDMLFLVNTNDSPICSEYEVMSEACRAPVISLSKESPGVADLVAPVMRPHDAQVHPRHSVAWGDKLDKAFFRGAPSCGSMPFPPSCARSWLARMAQINATQDLDAGLVERYDRPDQVKADPVLQDGHGPLPVLPLVPMDDLPKYKYLLSLDGHTAAYRLGHLLATNSLVLKQESKNVEHYYRSLRPYHHFVPILKHSEQDVMPRLLWARSHPQQVQHIIHNANHFAQHYTTYAARVLYWKYVLLAYRSLVPDMDSYFKLPPKSKVNKMEALLKNLAFGTIAADGEANGSPLEDPDVQHELDVVAAFAGEEAADVQEQELQAAQAAANNMQGGGGFGGLLALAGDDDK